MLKIILTFAIVIIISTTLLNRLSHRLGMPVLLAFIFLGMLFGKDGILGIPFDNYEMSRDLASLALIFIMFYGGFGTNWKVARPVAVKSTLMASLGVILTCLSVGYFCHLVLKMPLLEGMLLGAVVSSTDAASTFSILRSRNLSLKYGTDSLLEMESGSNDPFAYLLTVTFISMICGATEPSAVARLLIIQVTAGAGIGLILAYLASIFVNRFSFGNEGFQSAFVTAVALLSYAVPEAVGGNGYLSCYIVGIFLGNALKINRQSLVGAFDGITSLLQILIFFMLGLLSSPTGIMENFATGLLITLFMGLIARPIICFLILKPFHAPVNQIGIVSWAGLRGAASIVFAIMSIVNLKDLSIDLFNIVFCVVILSILIHGTSLGIAAKKLNMINPEGDVRKTFNDYSEEGDLNFISVKIEENTVWNNLKISQLNLPKQMLIVLMKRNNRTIIPNGDIRLRTGDSLVLSGNRFRTSKDILLKEEPITERHRWAYKYIRDIEFPKSFLIIIIKRGNKNIVPDGDTQVLPDDILVFNLLKKDHDRKKL